MKKKRREGKGKGWQISFSPILRYSALFCLLVLVVIIVGGAILACGQMEADAEASLTSVHAQISQRISESVNLLESLAALPEFYDPDIPPIDKVKKLDQMSPYFGYMMICYVDADITVYSDGSEPASLASRDYMPVSYTHLLTDAGIAQLVEQLIRNQQVVCSSHITSSKSCKYGSRILR